MADERWVLIQHPDGREYQVSPTTYAAQYAPLGFVIVRYADWSAYPDPAADETTATPAAAPEPAAAEEANDAD